MGALLSLPAPRPRQPSSSHRYADIPRTALARSRAKVAALIDVTGEEVVFTAMGLPCHRALAAVRLSLGRWSTPDNLTTAVTALTDAATAHDGRARRSTPSTMA
ncbi:hypothetical protein [Nocardia wallacei]|uniref:hypothetical protein n=1 Tax=Nocardia wallacei TaxID=480035 RepID=UPI002454955E|nr:hypothetical protein [Nocardia wallacei]